MQIHLLKTVPLAVETREAWKSQGVNIVRRKDFAKFIRSEPPIAVDDVVLTMGWRCDIIHPNVWNEFSSVRAISRPLELRETLGDYLPPHPNEGDGFWIKNHGMGGKGKVFVHPHDGMNVPTNLTGDVQKHISGTEYRVNTVGSYVIQAHIKNGDVMSGFDWEWCGVEGINNNGIIPMIKEAIQNVPNYETTVFGWDVIVCEETCKPYVLEVNTSAGVNEATAKRIVSRIEKHYNSELTTVS